MPRRTLYPAAALGLLAAADAFHGYAFLVLGPDIARTLGVGFGTIAAFAVVQALVIALAALPFSAGLRGRPLRALLCLAAAVLWAVCSLSTAIVSAPLALLAVLCAHGAATASVRTLHPALIADTYRPAFRMRALSAHRALEAAGAIAAPLLVMVLIATADLTWRGVFLVLGGVVLVAAAAGSGLRDPGPGRYEPVAPPSHLTTGEVVASLLAVPTLRRVYAAYAVFGVLAGPLYAYLFFFLEDRWGLEPDGRALFLAATALAAVGAAALFAGPAERLLAQGPGSLIGAAWKLTATAAVALAVAALAPSFGMMTAGFCMVTACFAVAQIAMTGVFVTVVEPEHRPHAGALAGIALAGVGGLGGLLALNGLAEALGLSGAIALLAIPGAVAALVLRSAQATADADLAELRARQAAALALAREVDPPLLSTRGLTVRYEADTVLRALDLDVRRGELVTLLGTNGAGKTTLLRTLAGLTPPATGGVRFAGADVTWLAPERRAAQGMRLMLGGRAVFGSLTVAESLRLAARAGTTPVADAYTAFPPLAARQDVRAAALSGGEQQMLGLAQALLARPRLLLVDELSLGLATPLVDELVAHVRALNTAGMTIILADQALDVALALGGRALFLDGGALHFDGPAGELARRDDLLRPTLLGRAAS